VAAAKQFMSCQQHPRGQIFHELLTSTLHQTSSTEPSHSLSAMFFLDFLAPSERLCPLLLFVAVARPSGAGSEPERPYRLLAWCLVYNNARVPFPLIPKMVKLTGTHRIST